MRKILIAFLLLMMGIGQAQANCGTYNHAFSWNAGSSLPCNEFNGNGIFNQNAPGQTVTQAFDFTQGVMPAGLTFVRASAGTYFDNTGTLQSASTNTPRFDHNPVTLAAIGLLMEEQRTNLLAPSVPTASWGGSMIAPTFGAALSPDNTMSATQSTEGTGTGAHYMTCPSSVSISTGSVYTASGYFKAGSSTVAQLVLGTGFDSLNFYANFDLANGVIGTVGSSVTAAMQNVGNGWYRCSITGTALANTAAANVAFAHANNSATWGRLTSYTVATGNSYFLWGAQVEAGAFATSYIPTTSATVTRAADFITTSSLSWYNAAQGALTVQGILEGVHLGVSTYLSEFSDGSANNRISQFLQSTSKPAGLIVVAGSATTSGGALINPAPLTIFKSGISYNSGANLYALNGSLDTAGTFGASAIPSGINRFDIFGARGISPASGWLQSAKYWNYALTAAQLQAATQ